MKELLGEPKYFRCQCGRLVTDRMIRLGACAGHGGLRYATSGTLWEWFLIKIHWLR